MQRDDKKGKARQEVPRVDEPRKERCVRVSQGNKGADFYDTV